MYTDSAARSVANHIFYVPGRDFYISALLQRRYHQKFCSQKSGLIQIGPDNCQCSSIYINIPLIKRFCGCALLEKMHNQNSPVINNCNICMGEETAVKAFEKESREGS